MIGETKILKDGRRERQRHGRDRDESESVNGDDSGIKVHQAVMEDRIRKQEEKLNLERKRKSCLFRNERTRDHTRKSSFKTVSLSA